MEKDVLLADCLCFGAFSRSRSLSLSAGSRKESEAESWSLRLESAAGISNGDGYWGVTTRTVSKAGGKGGRGRAGRLGRSRWRHLKEKSATTATSSPKTEAPLARLPRPVHVLHTAQALADGDRRQYISSLSPRSLSPPPSPLLLVPVLVPACHPTKLRPRHLRPPAYPALHGRPHVHLRRR